MPRVAGIDLPRDKKIEIALTYIYGIGRSAATKIMQMSKINTDKRVKDITEEEVKKLREIIEKNFKVEGELRRIIDLNIRRLIDIGTYRGLRHRRGLPVRGQRTHCNARTRKGKRRQVGTKRGK